MAFKTDGTSRPPRSSLTLKPDPVEPTANLGHPGAVSSRLRSGTGGFSRPPSGRNGRQVGLRLLRLQRAGAMPPANPDAAFSCWCEAACARMSTGGATDNLRRMHPVERLVRIFR